MRQLLPLGQFLCCSFSIVRKWSHSRDPNNENYMPFAKEPTIVLKQWTLGWQWIKEFSKSVKYDPNNTLIWFAKSEKGIPIVNSESIRIYNKQMSECKWKTFEELTNCSYIYSKIVIP